MQSKKIKIIHLITGLGIGGAEASLRDLVLGIDKNQFESVVVSLLAKREMARPIEQGGVRVICLNGNHYNPLLFFKLVLLLCRERPDILHTQLFHADSLGRFAGVITRIPKIVSTFQNVTFGGRWRELILASTRGLVDVHTAVSKIVLDHVIHIGIAKKKNSRIIYNAVDIEKYKPSHNRMELRNKFGIDVNKKIIISTGRLIEQKGFPYLMEAMRLLWQEKNIRDTQLIILGEGIDRGKLVSIQKSLPQGMVVLAGAVLNVVEYLQLADVFVMSSLWEGCSVALIEAGSMGLPVVATPVGIAPEVVIDGVNGILVPIQDSQAIASALEQVFTMPQEERNTLGLQLRQDIVNKFSTIAMIRDYEKLFKELKK